MAVLVLLGLADKVPGVVRVTSPLVLRDLWVRTEGARTIHHAIRQMRRNDLPRCNVSLYPVLKCLERIEGIRTWTTLAMLHPRRHEEAQEILCIGLTAHGFHYALIMFRSPP